MADTSAKAPAKKPEKKEELSADDIKLKEGLEYLVEKIVSPTEMATDKLRCIESLFNDIRVQTGTKTALPKQLKFLKPHYKKLREYYESLPDEALTRRFADFMSVACITLEDNYKIDSLRFYFKGTGSIVPESLGDEYLLNFAGDLAAEYAQRIELKADKADVYLLVQQILPSLFKHGHDINAIDLLLEIERLDLLLNFIDSSNYNRLFIYLQSSLCYASDSIEFNSILNTLYTISMSRGDHVNSLKVALRMNDYAKMSQVLESCQDPLVGL